ncbi:hypothetical protein HZS_5813, partial [Henneguya salminicola]
APNLVIQHPKQVLDNMCEWCETTHRQSGLTQKCRVSNTTVQKADEILYEFLKKHTVYKKSPLAGNTVHNDKKFMEKFMPRSYDFLHYRIIDVSSFHEIFLALEDIKHSINQMAHYKRAGFDKFKI